MGDDGSEGGSRARQRRCCVGDRSVAGAQGGDGSQSGRREGGWKGQRRKENGRSSRGDGLSGGEQRRCRGMGPRAAEEKVKVENSEGANPTPAVPTLLSPPPPPPPPPPPTPSPRPQPPATAPLAAFCRATLPPFARELACRRPELVHSHSSSEIRDALSATMLEVMNDHCTALVAASGDPGVRTVFHESSGGIWAFCKRNATSRNAIIHYRNINKRKNNWISRWNNVATLTLQLN
ncbi:hypothetical protein K0M31_006332 [Melipona bicolor]|uniref:Uncharacterized protein n=1 Tax=Melipona bicolor TaxID=60889 RepID=A0AA40FTC9_9HYME|nr:hypothetical protein K0M31_006332 [Melipona bicolor]